MAKTIEEICKDLAEWQKENQKERNILLIAGHKNNIQININGSKVLACVASSIESIPKVEDLVTEAMDLVNRYRREQRQKITEAFASPNHATSAVGTISADRNAWNERAVGRPGATPRIKKEDEKDRENRKI